MRNSEREAVAVEAANTVRQLTQLPFPFEHDDDGPIGLVLGTGWGDVLSVTNPFKIALSQIPGFSKINHLEGHARELVVGQVGNKRVLALRGRIHLNEAPADPELYKMVRLQIEMLLQLGVKNLILTSAVGALKPPTASVGNVGCDRLAVGDICVVDGFVTLFAPQMPLWGGEFCSPEDALDEQLQKIARIYCHDLCANTGGHVMLTGPWFEGRKYDKRFLAQTGAKVVGMSGLPEACVAALYPGVRVLYLCFVTNDDVEEHSHEENLARAKVASSKLGGYLERVIGRI
ncbi:MAG: purine-nucleoside phosphorylase [Candidatus Magasanikbacteria bacterium]|nr:purine-nucleoside phosphorylase [Candidatus Magasanikbacteria bacterium]